MKIAVLLLSLWAITATKAAPAITTPVTTAAAPAAPAAAAAPAAPAAAAAPAAPAAAAPATPAGKAPVVAPAALVASKYKVSFKLANVKYDAGLASYESALYQNYAGKIEKSIMNLYADDNAYREMKMIGFRNESGVIADISLRFGNESKNLASLDALIKQGALGTGGLPVDPASLKAEKDVSGPPMVMGYGCGPCGVQQQSPCCGGSSFMQSPMMGQQQYGAPMQPMGGMPMPGMPMPFPPTGMGMQMGGAGQCPGQCPNSCAPSCQQSCCGGGAGQMNPPMMG